MGFFFRFFGLVCYACLLWIILSLRLCVTLIGLLTSRWFFVTKSSCCYGLQSSCKAQDCINSKNEVRYHYPHNTILDSCPPQTYRKRTTDQLTLSFQFQIFFYFYCDNFLIENAFAMRGTLIFLELISS